MMHGGKTGYPAGLLQDDHTKLSKWFASKPDARMIVRQVCKEIMENKMTCTCHPLSPFLWAQHPRPSIFADDPVFKAKQSAKTGSQLATEVVERKRKDNVNYGTIYGSAREREDAIIRSKLMHIYSKAGTK